MFQIRNQSELTQRVIAAVIMAALALFALWIGGWFFTAFWFAAACGILIEWLRMVRSADASTNKPLWNFAGLIYAVAMFVSAVGLRLSGTQGLLAVLFVFAVVWGSDVAAYFAGRTFGGPKLAPRISPKKTWSGAIGGVLVGSLLAAGLGAGFGGYKFFSLMPVAIFLCMVSVCGDLLESAMKRFFNVKDSSQIIPGHGGFLDRLDGFVLAISAAALIGLSRGGASAISDGLLKW